MSRARMALAALTLALAGVAGTLLWVTLRGEDVGTASVGGPFTLTDETGRTVTEADFEGRPTVIFFGFTFCPDVCPTTLYELTLLMQDLGEDADKVNWLFVSVDSARDTPEQLAQYTSAFDSRILGLSGTEAQIAAIAKQYFVYYKRVPLEGGDYTMEHTATVFLMDSGNHLFGTIGYGEAPAMALSKLRRLVRDG
ncbi:SCO family protein (plasmid) [Paroceanicella profunda]|uniref:SCO family protein n=1 Tax=Paroceanicella profunda TaxID=2579971 RepID=A0A5B8G5G7_9RHOB|nr:SCO family protein [Paroceanicella profunda]QDL94572.1 SCO family protein [Paroceanicella profunda]